MTTDDRFGRTLSAWLEEEAGHRVPDHLAEVLLHTAATRQRPWWASPERWLPMTSLTMGGRVAAPRPAFVFTTLVLLVLATLGVVLLSGARLGPPSPFGLAGNGRIYVADGGVIRSFAADGTDRRDEFAVPGLDRFRGIYGMSASPDGSKLAFAFGADGTMTLDVLDTATGAVTTLPAPFSVAGDPIGWSPDGASITFPGIEGYAGRDRIYATRSDGTGPLLTPGGEDIAPDRSLWLPQYSPDGEWIAFMARPRSSTDADIDGDLVVMHPDGTAFEVVASGITVGHAWAPDEDLHRLLYATSTGPMILDLDTRQATAFGEGDSAVWSPDGAQIAYWDGGPVVVRTEDALRGVAQPVPVFERIPDLAACEATLGRAGRGVCSPIAWSPDGTMLIGADGVGSGLLMAPADGTGEPIPLALDEDNGPYVHVAWQPIR